MQQGSGIVCRLASAEGLHAVEQRCASAYSPECVCMRVHAGSAGGAVLGVKQRHALAAHARRCSTQWTTCRTWQGGKCCEGCCGGTRGALEHNISRLVLGAPVHAPPRVNSCCICSDQTLCRGLPPLCLVVTHARRRQLHPKGTRPARRKQRSEACGGSARTCGLLCPPCDGSTTPWPLRRSPSQRADLSARARSAGARHAVLSIQSCGVEA